MKLAGYESLRIGRYSRGMVQRLGIAQALIGDPHLLVLDEPTSGLDPSGRREVLDLVHSLKQAGKTILLSSHILSDVEQICDRVIIIDRGCVRYSGPLQEILRAGGGVEIIVDQLPEDTERTVSQWGVHIDRGTQGIRLIVESARKRALVEFLWVAGCDVVRVNPMKDSLEEIFLKLVGESS